jgi:hypothetical protein
VWARSVAVGFSSNTDPNPQKVYGLNSTGICPISVLNLVDSSDRTTHPLSPRKEPLLNEESSFGPTKVICSDVTNASPKELWKRPTTDKVKASFKDL